MHGEHGIRSGTTLSCTHCSFPGDRREQNQGDSPSVPGRGRSWAPGRPAAPSRTANAARSDSRNPPGPCTRSVAGSRAAAEAPARPVCAHTVLSARGGRRGQAGAQAHSRGHAHRTEPGEHYCKWSSRRRRRRGAQGPRRAAPCSPAGDAGHRLGHFCAARARGLTTRTPAFFPACTHTLFCGFAATLWMSETYRVPSGASKSSSTSKTSPLSPRIGVSSTMRAGMTRPLGSAQACGEW